MNFGYGFAPAHHGEMLQGVFRSSGGSFRQGLISLPCDLFWSETFFLSDSSGVVRVQPANKWKSRRAAEIALAYLGKRSAGGRLFISSRVPEKLGLGSSSSDVVAAVRAVASSFKIRLSPEEISRISIQAEIPQDIVSSAARTSIRWLWREDEFYRKYLKDLISDNAILKKIGIKAAIVVIAAVKTGINILLAPLLAAINESIPCS